MTTPPLADDILIEAALAYRAHNDNKTFAAQSLGLPRNTFVNRLARAAERGLLGPQETLPGFRITKLTTTPHGETMQQKPDGGVPFELTDSLAVKGKTSWLRVLPDGQRIAEREVIMERAGAADALAAMRAAVDAFKEELPRMAPAARSARPVREDLLNFYGVTDNHFGMLSWKEETGADYDVKIAEQLFLDWFAAAIDQSPDAHTAVFGQIGDVMHHDSLESVTPAHRHVLDADSRLQKVIRVVIRCMRRVIDMLLEKHEHVHVIMASGNHDPASSAWLREMFAVFYENEPRITVDNSPSLYYAYEWGNTALFLHHGHKRGVANVDVTMAGMFRELFGRSKYAYCHIGHLHSDEGRKSGLMYVERHETLAAPDAFAAGGGWLSGRSAKRITYSKMYGEVGRDTLRPEMVAGAYDRPVAANDNGERRAVA